jgi:TPR repeat protein
LVYWGWSFAPGHSSDLLEQRIGCELLEGDVMVPKAFCGKYPPADYSGQIFRGGRWLIASMLCLHGGMSAIASEPVPVTPEQAYQLALEARTVGDYPAMLALLRQAGEGGDRPAQEMLGTVLLAAPVLYGGSIEANPCEAAQWIRLAVEQGSGVGRHQSKVLNGLRDLPACKYSK